MNIAVWISDCFSALGTLTSALYDMWYFGDFIVICVAVWSAICVTRLIMEVW